MVDDKLWLSGRDSLNASLGLFSSGVYIDWQCLQKKSWKLLKTMKTKTKIENNKRLVARKKKFIFFFRLTRNAVSVYRNFLNLFKFLELCKQFTNKVWRKDRHTHWTGQPNHDFWFPWLEELSHYRKKKKNARGHSIMPFALREEGDHQNTKVSKQEGGRLIPMQTFAYNFFFIEHLVHELLTIITRL